MIGQFIGAGIGTLFVTPNAGFIQVQDISGFIKIPGDGCLCDTADYSLDAQVVQGNDIRLRLSVYDTDGGEIALDGFDDIVWSMRATIDGPVILQKRLNNGITVSDAIYAEISGPDDINDFYGTFVHEFLIVKSGYYSTVVADRNLAYGSFLIRKKITAP